jgi:hypothetical protein
MKRVEQDGRTLCSGQSRLFLTWGGGFGVRFIVSLPNWLLIGSLMVLLGCATDRTIEVKVSRVVVELSPSEGITAEVAQSMFYEVAARSGLLVQAPIELPGGTSEYFTETADDLRKNLQLGLWVEPKWVKFESSISGYAKDLSVAKEPARRFAEVLEQRGTPYNARTWIAVIPF